MRRIRATLPGSASTHTGPSASSRAVTIPRSPVPSSNSASTARLSSPSSTGSERSCDLGVDPAEVEQVGGQAGEPPRLRSGPGPAAPGHPGGRGRRRADPRRAARASRRARSSGVRSSCEAVATNARRASSWWRRRSCMIANVRARSPTSSRTRSTGTSTLGPAAASSSAEWRSRRSRRTSRPESGIPSMIVKPEPGQRGGDERGLHRRASPGRSRRPAGGPRARTAARRLGTGSRPARTRSLPIEPEPPDRVGGCGTPWRRRRRDRRVDRPRRPVGGASRVPRPPAPG